MTLHKRWTQEQKALLEQLYSDINRSWEELAEMLGHSQSSIQSQASKLGLCPTSYTQPGKMVARAS